MNRLYSPWRSRYIDSFRTASAATECLFCSAAASRNDVDNLVVARGKRSFVIMNLYPYNSGHVMVVPFTHTSSLNDLSPAVHAEMLGTVARMIDVLTAVMRPDGFNVGVNLGRSAGAGIERHLHIHVVPRWNGDTNFMPTLADTKVVSEELKKTYGKLKQALRSGKKKTPHPRRRPR